MKQVSSTVGVVGLQISHTRGSLREEINATILFISKRSLVDWLYHEVLSK
mgnify:CR=1 FL=1